MKGCRWHFNVIKLVSCSTKLSMKCILLINVKMPANVDSLSVISMVNSTLKSVIARKLFIFSI